MQLALTHMANVEQEELFRDVSRLDNRFRNRLDSAANGSKYAISGSGGRKWDRILHSSSGDVAREALKSSPPDLDAPLTWFQLIVRALHRLPGTEMRYRGDIREENWLPNERQPFPYNISFETFHRVYLTNLRVFETFQSISLERTLYVNTFIILQFLGNFGS